LKRVGVMDGDSSGAGETDELVMLEE